MDLKVLLWLPDSPGALVTFPKLRPQANEINLYLDKKKIVRTFTAKKLATPPPPSEREFARAKAAILHK